MNILVIGGDNHAIPTECFSGSESFTHWVILRSSIEVRNIIAPTLIRPIAVVSVPLDDTTTKSNLTFINTGSLRQPVVEPYQEARSSQDIILQIAQRMGLTEAFPFASYTEFLEAQLEGTGIDLGRLRREGFVELPYEPGQALAAGLTTPSGKVELVSSVISFAGEDGLPKVANWPEATRDKEYPLNLITYKVPWHTLSATTENPYLRAIQDDNHLLVNPLTAKSLGLETGDLAVVESRRGSLEVVARLTEGIRPDTVAISHHFGHTAYARDCIGKGVNANSILSGETDPLGGNVTFNDSSVRVRKA